MSERRPRLALPFTVVPAGDRVHLIAGEDVRYTFTAPGLDGWLPELLRRLDGRLTAEQLLECVSEPFRADAVALLERLYGERIIVDGGAPDNHPAAACGLVVEGTGAVADLLAPYARPAEPRLRVFCQDGLDLAAALAFNRGCLGGQCPWLWVTTGPLQRGYVSPVFLPQAGPCLGCLVRHFRRLSPAPGLYDALLEHGARGLAFTPATFPAEGAAVLAQLVLWKWRLLGAAEPPAALYRLHVLETDSLEVSSHRVFVDPDCPDCQEGGR